MSPLTYDNEDTIVALSTGPDAALRAIIRLTGPDALALAQAVFVPAAPAPTRAVAARRPVRRRGRCRITATETCPAEAYLFFAPRSYTGQDVVELHLPGSPALSQMVLGLLLAAGARTAEPGEFTARAFLNGRLDLSQAEAVNAVINAQSDAQLRAAQSLLGGALQRRCATLTDHLTDLLSLVELSIDFSEEDVTIAAPETLAARAAALAADLEALLAESVSWERLASLPTVMLIGPANAGKSALANRLMGSQRSIVSQLAGTTRDVLTGPWRLPGGECLLMDAAGLTATADRLGRESLALTLEAAGNADLLIWVFDVAGPPNHEDAERLAAELGRLPRPALLAANKIDLLDETAPAETAAARYWRRRWPESRWAALSALTGAGVTELQNSVDEMLGGDRATTTAATTMALNARQRTALQHAANDLHQGLRLLAEQAEAELVAVELRAALENLAAIAGVLTDVEDVLTRIFGRFCIGK